MNIIEHYLAEKEQFYYPNEPKAEDNSDIVLNSDDFMYSNTDAQSYYARGNGFNIEDNQEFYQVVKLVKDMTDKHIFFKDLTWKVNIAHRKAVFIFKIGNKEDNRTDDVFLQGVHQFVSLECWRRYGDLFNIGTEFTTDLDNNRVMILTVQKNEGEKEKIQKTIGTRVPDSASFITKTSISSM